MSASRVAATVTQFGQAHLSLPERAAHVAKVIQRKAEHVSSLGALDRVGGALQDLVKGFDTGVPHAHAPLGQASTFERDQASGSVHVARRAAFQEAARQLEMP